MITLIVLGILITLLLLSLLTYRRDSGFSDEPFYKRFLFMAGMMLLCIALLGTIIFLAWLIMQIFGLICLAILWIVTNMP